jgi:AraC-like DNA-binding protein
VVYREIEPHGQFRPWIHCYWELQGCLTEPQVIYPDGRPEMVFHYADPFIRDGCEQGRALYAGQLTSVIAVRPAGRTEVFGVRFTPPGGWAFGRFPQTDVEGVVVPLDDVCGPAGLTERMLNARTTSERVACIERVLHERLPSHASTIDLLATAVAEGYMPAREAQVESGYCERQWQRVFRQRTGVGPKMLERIGRFRRALQLSEYCSWADVAAQCEYSDQAHLVRDFREFTGEPPTRAGGDLFG